MQSLLGPRPVLQGGPTEEVHVEEAHSPTKGRQLEQSQSDFHQGTLAGSVSHKQKNKTGSKRQNTFM